MNAGTTSVTEAASVACAGGRTRRESNCGSARAVQWGGPKGAPADRRGACGPPSGSIPSLLERCRFDDARQEGGKAALFFFELFHNSIDGFHIIILQTPSECISKQFFGEAAIKIGAVLGHQDSLQVADSAEGLSGDQFTRGIQRLAPFLLAPH